MDMTIDLAQPVLVTGATGYIAGWVIQRLLAQGLTVHATVRDASKTERLAHLHKLAEGIQGSLRFFSADLLDEGSFDAAMAGCGTVFHLASPFTLDISDPDKELVQPAARGTRNVLEAANRTPSVARVVVTSSCAAIYSDNADLADTPDGVFTEEIWNTRSSLDHQPYSYSKTLAEREAWKIAEAQNRWRLVVVNPCGVFGPGITLQPSSESFKILTQLGDGSLAPAAPDLGLGVVDVRDLADAHLRAAFLPDAQGRYIIAAHDTSLPEMARVLKARFPTHKLPTMTAPKALIWLIGPWVNKALTRKTVSRNIGLPWKGDNSKSRRELGMTYRTLEETLHDHFQQLIDHGALRAA
jgi:nucleoside-diphosphate-sugar epimerase